MTAPTRDRSAIALSVAVHACAFAGLLLVPRIPDVGADEVLISTVRVERLAVRMKQPSTPAPRVMPAVAARTVVAFRPAPARAPVIAERNRPQATVVRRAAAPSRRREAAPPHAIAAVPQTEAAEATVAGTESAGTAPSAEPVATAAPTAQPTPVVVADRAPAGAAQAIGFGPFGSMQPPVILPPGTAETLRTQIGGHYLIRITVDENGRATGVEFVTGLDASARDTWRSRFLSARYVPAECNGIRCDGTLELRG